MKNYLKAAVALGAFALLCSCKGEGIDGKEQGQDPVTANGQHIGASADSTTVDGQKGELSNN